MKRAVRTLAVLALVTIIAAVGGCRSAPSDVGSDSAAVALQEPVAFGQAGDQAAATLLKVYYAGNGLWRDCNNPACGIENQDWGVDSATYALYLRWKITHDASAADHLRALIATAPRYPPPCERLPCNSWSDVPEWDAIALMRDYEASGGDAGALSRAKDAFRLVQDAKVFALGACPAIHYQIADGKPGYMLKTLETDANYLKAALLLYRTTKERSYLTLAIQDYASVRRYFLDAAVPLYSVYVYDDGTRCTQVPHRFFASVNGDMIWGGVALFHITGQLHYLSEALSTARAVDAHLSDGRGIFADLQAENDVEEPLVEAMYDLAADEHQAFARNWILRNAEAALASREPDGSFPRFWDGPPPASPIISTWQSNGGLALEIAAGGLAPTMPVTVNRRWVGARFVQRRIDTMPAMISFYGSGIALVGTMGARCCQPGHARVFVDGVETFDRTGIWQNKSMTGSVPRSVLFAWSWPRPGQHTIRIEPAQFNAKEGGPFIALDGYQVSDN